MADPRNTPLFRVETIATPAAGGEIAVTPTNAGGWLVRSIAFTFTTDATAPDRSVSMTVDDGGSPYMRLAVESEQQASLARNYSGYAGSAGAFGSVPNIAIGFPADGVWLPQGHVLRTSTSEIAAGDQFSAVRISVFEFPAGPREFYWPFVATLLEESS